jgi:hypothetical protein
MHTFVQQHQLAQEPAWGQELSNVPYKGVVR